MRSKEHRLEVFLVGEEDGREVRRATFHRDQMAAVHGHSCNIDVSRSTKLLNVNSVFLGHPDGTINLFSLGSSREEEGGPLTVRYSDSDDSDDSAENFIKRGVLTANFFGVVFHRTSSSTSGGGENCCNFALFSSSDGSPMASARDLEVYGQVYFSATNRHFIFSFADALHNQHFIVHDFSVYRSTSCSPSQRVAIKKFTLRDRCAKKEISSRHADIFFFSCL